MKLQQVVTLDTLRQTIGKEWGDIDYTSGTASNAILPSILRESHCSSTFRSVATASCVLGYFDVFISGQWT